MIQSKLKVSILILASLIISFSLYYYLAIYNSVKIISGEASYRGYSTADEMFKDADLVIIGTPSQDYLNRNHRVTYYGTKDIQDFYTLTNIKVQKALKGSESLKDLDIVEPYSVIQQFDGKKVLTWESYTPLKKGSKYILFLKDNSHGQYSVMNMQSGKFNIDNSDEDDLNHVSEKKKQFKREIESKYMKELN